MIHVADLTDEQVDVLIRHFRNEVFDLADPALVLNTGSDWANNQRRALEAMEELKRKRIEIKELSSRVCGPEIKIAGELVPCAAARMD